MCIICNGNFVANNLGKLFQVKKRKTFTKFYVHKNSSKILQHRILTHLQLPWGRLYGVRDSVGCELGELHVIWAAGVCNEPCNPSLLCEGILKMFQR